jgi:hypothetical protein
LPEFAVKEWRVQDGLAAQKVRRNIWFPDRLERWESSGGGQTKDSWYPIALPDDTDEFDKVVWPLPNVKQDGTPMGIPYIHFVNGGRMNGNYGMSELSCGVLGFQDQLNDLQYALSAAGRLTAFPQYWGAGIKLKNKEGSTEKMPVETAPGMFHTTENKDAKFGMFQSGDMSQIISVYLLKKKCVAMMTSTPIHIITGGDWPSAEALMRAELPAVGKARKQIASFKTAWVNIATYAMKVGNASPGVVNLNYDVKLGVITAKFADPEKRDVVSRSIVVHNLGPNCSFKEALRIMGYNEEQVIKIYEEKKAEATDFGQGLLTGFAQGKFGIGSQNANDNKEATGGTTNGGTANPKQ